MCDYCEILCGMSSIWYAVIAGVIVLLVSFVGSRIWHRVTKTTKPRFSREAGTSARATLNRTKNIFNSAISLGGRLAYPWKIKDGTVTEPEMQEALDAIQAEMVDKELRESIVTIKKQLRDVFAAAREVIPMVVYSGCLSCLIKQRPANLKGRLHRGNGTQQMMGSLPPQQRSRVWTS